MTYADFINNVTEHYGRCREVTDRMVQQFPELRQVRGYYHCPIWGEREHWWCVDPNGKVVDPTFAQFPSKGIGEYVEYHGPEATGMCPECGGYCFDGNYFCSEPCKTSYMEYIRTGNL